MSTQNFAIMVVDRVDGQTYVQDETTDQRAANTMAETLDDSNDYSQAWVEPVQD